MRGTLAVTSPKPPLIDKKAHFQSAGILSSGSPRLLVMKLREATPSVSHISPIPSVKLNEEVCLNRV